MYKVKRVKDGAERHAAKVLPDGKVGAWAGPDEAVVIDRPLADKVIAEYKDRPAAGQVTVYSVEDRLREVEATPPRNPPPAAAAPADAKPADAKPAAHGKK